jgi:hypothetical protein
LRKTNSIPKVFFTLFLVFSGAKSFAQVSPLAGFYDIAPHKSLAIDYESQGMLEGSIRVYISGDTAVAVLDQHFANQAGDPKTSIKAVEIHLPDGVYSFDLNAGTGRKLENRRYLLKKGLTALSKADRDYFAGQREKLRAQWVARLLGPEDKPAPVDFLGRRALRYQLSTGAVLTLWNGILLQMVVPSANINLTATRIDYTFNAPDSVFDLIRRADAVYDPKIGALQKLQVEEVLAAVRSRRLPAYFSQQQGRKK